MDHPETVINIRDNLQLICPAFPHECEYVQVIKDNEEIGYWDWKEFQDDPKVVLGALLGLLRREL